MSHSMDCSARRRNGARVVATGMHIGALLGQPRRGNMLLSLSTGPERLPLVCDIFEGD